LSSRRKRGLEQRSAFDFVSAPSPPGRTGSMHVKCSVSPYVQCLKYIWHLKLPGTSNARKKRGGMMQSGGVVFIGAFTLAVQQRTFDEEQHFCYTGCGLKWLGFPLWDFFAESFRLVGLFMQRATFIHRRNKRRLSIECRTIPPVFLK